MSHLLHNVIPQWRGGLIRQGKAKAGTAFGAIAKSTGFPIYAIVLGLLGNLVLTSSRLRDRLLAGFRTLVDGAGRGRAGFRRPSCA